MSTLGTQTNRSPWNPVRLTDADERRLAKLLELTERYCVVLQTLTRSPELSVALN